MKWIKLFESFENEWAVVGDKMEKEFEFKDFSEALAFINELALICERQNHHPEISWVYNKVKLGLSTHDANDTITEKDLKLSKAIDEILKGI